MAIFINTVIENVEDIFKLRNGFLDPFIFRGQQKSNWELSTSIERAKKVSVLSMLQTYNTEEKWMLDEFMRKFHLYSARQIGLDEKLEWLSIMQHHGSPTRLLDFTYSIFIAMYFACIDSDNTSSIWAINRYTLRDNLHKAHNLPYENGVALKDEINALATTFADQYIAREIRKNEVVPNTIVPIEPRLYTERLTKQQGLFLVPINPKISFTQNLEFAFDVSSIQFKEYEFSKLVETSKAADSEDTLGIIKFDVPNDCHNNILTDLKRMNITAEVLFPGLDGLARSLLHSHLRTIS